MDILSEETAIRMRGSCHEDRHPCQDGRYSMDILQFDQEVYVVQPRSRCSMDILSGETVFEIRDL